jgi:alpha-tubulin suppressor-like RCC1 family protein
LAACSSAGERHSGKPDLAERPDLAMRDFAAADLAAGDLAMRDLATPDREPDLAMPDLATPDLAMPDLATPDFAMPDLATPDLTTLDLTTLDLTTLDLTTLDLTTRDLTTRDLTTFDLAIGSCPGAWSSITMGGNNTCGLSSGGAAWCWGDDTFAEVCDGTSAAAPLLSPVRAGGTLTFTQLATGGVSTCGLATDGKTWCWGGDDHGQVGTSNATASGSFPIQTTPVQRFPGRPFSQITVGRDHACGLAAGGVAYCWGDNTYGELGCAPADVNCMSGDSGGNSPVVAAESFTWIGAGQNFTCALDTLGKAWCWGENGHGECATGGVGGTVSAPSRITGGLTFNQLSVGPSGACGIATDGFLYCWGVNNGGATDACCTVIAVAAPGKVALPGGASPASVSAGFVNSCAVSTTGALYCWGTNRFGAMGLGSSVDSGPWTPTLIPNLPTIASVTALNYSACAVATDGRRFCWGFNGYGQLGDGTTTERDAPEYIAPCAPQDH